MHQFILFHAHSRTLGRLIPRHTNASTRATLRDVAALAGVSIKTASRVVNSEPGVAAEKVKAVQEAVAQLDYRPNHSASSLRRADRRTSSVGAILENLANPFSAEVLRALEDEARERGMIVFAGSVDGNAGREHELVRAFSLRADALVVVPISQHHGYLERELANATPVVFVDRPPVDFAADAVVADNADGADRAVRHLAAHGHRRIAFLGDDRRIATARERFEGFGRAMGDLGLPVRHGLVAHNAHTPSEAEQAVDRMLDAELAPTAFFSARNAITVAAVRALQRRRLEHKVALVGFDDFPLSDLVRPGISVMAQDPAAMGKLAAGLLFARLAGDDSPPETSVVRTRLIERGSGEIPAPDVS